MCQTVFLSFWMKKGSVHKTGDMQYLKHHSLVSLLLIWGTVLECLTYIISHFFTENKSIVIGPPQFILNSKFTFSIFFPRHAWPDPIKMATLICSFCKCLTAYKNFKIIPHFFLGTLVTNYFGALYACPSLAGLIHLKLHNQFEVSMDDQPNAKNNTITQLITDILVICSYMHFEPRLTTPN